MYIEFSITKAYFEQAECKCFTESGIVHTGYINPELQDLAMQFFQIFVRHVKNRLAVADILDRVDNLSYVTKRYD